MTLPRLAAVALGVLLTPLFAAAQAAPAKFKVCLVSGSFEYKSDASLAAFQAHLEKNFPVVCTRAFAASETEIGGLDNLEKADAAIFFTRRLKIAAAELEKVKAFVASGKPVVGVRTASHGFQGWLEMDKDVFGGDYKNHLKAGVPCDVVPTPAGKDHPVLAGVKPFRTLGSLYKNPNVAADVAVLLTGTAGKDSYPVAWVREKDKRRAFYTSLGTPDDFADPNFVRLLTNALGWAAKVELTPAK